MILFLKLVISYFAVTWAINYKPKEETPPKTQTYEECGELEAPTPLWAKIYTYVFLFFLVIYGWWLLIPFFIGLWIYLKAD
jgi:hypothetical protein